MDGRKKSAAETYHDGMEWKRNLHKENGTKLLELYAYEMMENHLLEDLERILLENNVVLKPMTADKMWEHINENRNHQLERVTDLFSTVINLTKSNDCDLKEIRNRNRSLLNLKSIDNLIDLIEPVFKNYQNMLLNNQCIDFNDMINRAARYVEQGLYTHSYKYVVIDEYQDISQARYRLLKTMRDQKDYKLFCVGDDWQSIYRFTGSDIGFILNFQKYWGVTEMSRIETTYRFSQSLIEVSSGFIEENPEQQRKDLKSSDTDHSFSLGVVRGYNEKTVMQYLQEKISDLPVNSTVFLLGRYRFDIRMLDKAEAFSYRYDAGVGKIMFLF